MKAPGTRWVATIIGSGMEPSELVGDSRDELEQRLGDLMDLHLGRLRWTIEERLFADLAPSRSNDEQLSLDF